MGFLVGRLLGEIEPLGLFVKIDGRPEGATKTSGSNDGYELRPSEGSSDRVIEGATLVLDVGSAVSERVGDTLGRFVSLVGTIEGARLGLCDGSIDSLGESVGTNVGFAVGEGVGDTIGASVSIVGKIEGDGFGFALGVQLEEGCVVGVELGRTEPVGLKVGIDDGRFDGVSDGSIVGDLEGEPKVFMSFSNSS